MAEQYSLYILECADGSLYTGIARDVSARLEQHSRGPRGAKYLRGRGPLKLVFSAAVGDRSLAQRCEYRVKRLRRSRKLALIEGAARLDELLGN